ncbi:MAG: type II toxin-antitoxin system prevent-host-death family antitoxin [Deltaproteobacteria bacterium]|nr:type II toxin-antitoxin system prevent-host-death family antitoxin [Deltaproteobacteria bacterium]
MIKVKVGELRNHLSKYLKKVRQGMEVIIKDRNTPIGRIVPLKKGEEEAFDLIPPKKGYETLKTFSGMDVVSSTDPVEILLEERSRR